MKTLTTITATPSGKDRHGQPLKPRTYVVDERREDWGPMEEAITGRTRENLTRVFVRRPDLDAYPGQECFAPEVVLTDSIVEEVAR